MTERGHAYALRSAMTKTPRNPPSSTGAPRPPAAAPRPDGAGPPADEAPAASNPFASLASSSLGEPGGETKLYEVPRELIEIARARAAEPKASSSGTLTPIAPRPNAELEATLAAYTAGLAGTSSARTPSSRPSRGEPGARQEQEPSRSHAAGAFAEESGTVLRRDAVRTPETPPQLPGAPSGRSEPARRASERLPVLERKAVLRSPVSPSSKPVARPRSTPVAAPQHGQPWLLYLGLCVILGYCVYLLLRS